MECFLIFGYHEFKQIFLKKDLLFFQVFRMFLNFLEPRCDNKLLYSFSS